MTPMLCARPLIALSLLVVSSCASSASDPGQSVLVDIAPLRSDAAASMRSLERREIAAFEGRPLSEALGELRPAWLRATRSVGSADVERGPVVYANDVPAGSVASLKTIPSDAVAEVRFLRAVEAQMLFGPACRCPAGVISVRTRVER